jgi:hypothetical protein
VEVRWYVANLETEFDLDWTGAGLELVNSSGKNNKDNEKYKIEYIKRSDNTNVLFVINVICWPVCVVTTRPPDT